MTTVIGVRFRTAGKVYYFDPGDIEYTQGQNVIVETARGIEYGVVINGNKAVGKEGVIQPLKKVIRLATKEDQETERINKEREKEAFRVCKEKIIKHNLEMKLVDVEYTFDNNKILFYFTSDDRVDFRELVKDLAAIFRTRIELRQIGVRDETKMCGGIGICGRGLCCNTFLSDFQPVSIKMAKEQNLSLNPIKISGICGRLMCCLQYEEESYQEIKSRLPEVGEIVMTPEGKGQILSVNLLREQIKVAVEKKEKNKVIREAMVFKAEDIQVSQTSSCKKKCCKKDGNDEKNSPDQSQ